MFEQFSLKMDVLELCYAATVILCGSYLLTNLHRRNQPGIMKEKRRWQARPIFREAARMRSGQQNLIAEMRLYDTESFFNFTRMSVASFDELLAIVGPYITKCNVLRNSITPSTRLAITLRYVFLNARMDIGNNDYVTFIL